MLWIDRIEITAALRSSLVREYDRAHDRGRFEVADDVEQDCAGAQMSEELLFGTREDALRQAESRARTIAGYLGGEVRQPTGWDLLLAELRRRAGGDDRG